MTWRTAVYLLFTIPLTAQIGSRSPRDTLLYYAASDNDSVAVRAYYYLSYQNWESNLDTALHYNRLMLERSTAAGRDYARARAYHSRGVIYSMQGYPDSSMYYYYAALQLLDEIGQSRYQRHVYNSMGSTYLELDSLSAARDAYRRALAIAGPGGKPSFRAAVYYNLANLFIEENQPDSAEVYLQPLHQLVESDSELADYLPHVQLNLGRIALSRGEEGVAVPLLQKCIDNATRLDQSLNVVIASINLGIAHTELGQYKQAAKLLNGAVLTARKQRYTEQVRNAYEELAHLDSLRRDYRSALDNYQMYIQLRDTIDNADRRTAIAELQAAYNQERNERTIAELKLSSELATLRANRRDQQLLWAGIVLLLLFVLAVSYYRSARRQRRLVAEKELLVYESNHRNRNHLSIIIGLLQLQIEDLDQESHRRIVAESQRRVESVSLIHEQLHRHGEGGERVAMHEYLPRLLELLLRYDPSVHYETDELATCWLKVDRAVTVGLIVNELVTNSLKYSRFADQEEELVIQIRTRAGRNNTTLEYRDNGPGYTKEALQHAEQSGGLFIVRNLSRQLGGSVELINEGGAVALIDFPIGP